MTKMKKRQFYCVKCRKKRMADKDDIYVKIYKNRKSYHGETPVLKGECYTCGTPLTKFISYDNEDKYIKEFGM